MVRFSPEANKGQWLYLSSDSSDRRAADPCGGGIDERGGKTDERGGGIGQWGAGADHLGGETS